MILTVKWSARWKVVEFIIYTAWVYDWALMMVMWGQKRKDSDLELEELDMNKVFLESASIRIFSGKWLFFLELG